MGGVEYFKHLVNECRSYHILKTVEPEHDCSLQSMGLLICKYIEWGGEGSRSDNGGRGTPFPPCSEKMQSLISS